MYFFLICLFLQNPGITNRATIADDSKTQVEGGDEAIRRIILNNDNEDADYEYRDDLAQKLLGAKVDQEIFPEDSLDLSRINVHN